MQVNFNFGQQRNTFIKSPQLTSSFKANSVNGNQSKAGNSRKDSVNISPQGKMMNMVEELTKQKEVIAKNRAELVSETSENGGTLKSIKSQLKMYSEQVESIDEQIANLYAEQAKMAMSDVDKDKKSKPKEADPNKSEETIEIEKLTNIANVSNSVKQTELVSAVKDKAEGDMRVKQSEIHIGDVAIDKLVSKGLIPGPNGQEINVEDRIKIETKAVKQKASIVSEIETTISQIDIIQSGQLSETSSDLNEIVNTDEKVPSSPSSDESSESDDPKSE